MKSILVLRITILACAFLGCLLAIIAVAGQEWQKSEFQVPKFFSTDIIPRKIVLTNGLWKHCSKVEGIGTRCMTMKIEKGKHDITKAFLIISILLYGVVFVLLALAQFLKKEIFQKIIAPAFWFTLLSGIIAMGCYTSISKDFNNGVNVFSYSWAYGIGWASTVVALIGATISSASLFVSSKEYEGSSMNFKK